jgi:hypothetical protein
MWMFHALLSFSWQRRGGIGSGWLIVAAVGLNRTLMKRLSHIAEQRRILHHAPRILRNSQWTAVRRK